MITFWIIVAYAFYVYANIGIAEINRNIVRMRQHQGNPKQIEHPLWATIYCMLIAPSWFWLHSWYYVLALLLLHLSVFPVAFNMYMGEEMFHLSKTSKAITDRIMVWMGFKDTFIVNAVALIISITLFIIQISK
jgi:hypothetical protein